MSAPTHEWVRAEQNSATSAYLRQPLPAREAVAAFERVPILRQMCGDRFLTRPVFVSAADHARLSADLLGIYRLIVSLPERLYGGDLRRFARDMGWAPPQIDTVLTGATRAPMPVGRADLYQEADGFRLLELNMGSAMGGMWNVEMNRALLREPEFARFATDAGIDFVDTIGRMVETMRAALPGLPDGAVVGLVDWPSTYDGMVPLLTWVAEQLRGFGMDPIPCHAGEVTSGNDGLYARGRRLDAVYRWFIIQDVLDGPDAPALVRRILDAADSGAVALFAPLEVELYGNKACLALLGDERNAAAFDAEERALVERFVPWTRMLAEREAETPDGRTDLVRYVRAHRDDLILKPTALHGGQGVVPGWTVDQHEWEARVDEALTAPYIVQRRARPVAEEVPTLDGDGETEPVVLNWGVYLTSDGYGGAHLRGVADSRPGVISMGNQARVGCAFHEVGAR